MHSVIQHLYPPSWNVCETGLLPLAVRVVKMLLRTAEKTSTLLHGAAKSLLCIESLFWFSWSGRFLVLPLSCSSYLSANSFSPLCAGFLNPAEWWHAQLLLWVNAFYLQCAGSFSLSRDCFSVKKVGGILIVSDGGVVTLDTEVSLRENVRNL